MRIARSAMLAAGRVARGYVVCSASALLALPGSIARGAGRRATVPHARAAIRRRTAAVPLARCVSAHRARAVAIRGACAVARPGHSGTRLRCGIATLRPSPGNAVRSSARPASRCSASGGSVISTRCRTIVVATAGKPDCKQAHSERAETPVSSSELHRHSSCRKDAPGRPVSGK